MATNKQFIALGRYEELIPKPLLSIGLAYPGEEMVPQFCRTNYDIVCFGSSTDVALSGIVSRFKQNRVYPPSSNVVAEFAVTMAGIPPIDLPSIVKLVDMVSTNSGLALHQEIGEKWYDENSKNLSFNLPESRRGLVVSSNIRRVMDMTLATDASLSHWQRVEGFEPVSIAEITVRNTSQIGEVMT